MSQTYRVRVTTAGGHEVVEMTFADSERMTSAELGGTLRDVLDALKLRLSGRSFVQVEQWRSEYMGSRIVATFAEGRLAELEPSKVESWVRATRWVR